MSKQLYAYSIKPGDPDHLGAYYFIDGVVEAEPEEIDAIVKELEPDHFDLLRVRPVDEAKISLEKFRVDVGSGLGTYHGAEVNDDEPCEVDRPFIEAYERDTYGAEGDRESE